MKTYIKPEMDITIFDTEDIIVTSNPGDIEIIEEDI